VIKPILPFPAVQGTRRVTLLMLQALGAEHEVTLAAPFLSPGDAGAAGRLEELTGCRVLGRPAPNRRSPFHRAWYKGAYLLQSVLGGHSPRALYAAPPGLVAAVAGFTRREPVDLAIFEYWYTYRYLESVRARRRVLLAHDAEFAVNRLAAGGRDRPVGRAGRRFWAGREARREAAACRAVDQVWTLTADDAEALAGASSVPRDRFRVMPFGVDTRALDLPAGGGGETVLFFGSFAADFNCDALVHLLDSIWPRLAAARPSARLVVAGGGLPDALQARVRGAGAAYAGAVEDVKSLYASAAVVLIPLRFGGGLRIRLIEALACSRAVVATPVGVGGIEGRAGVHFAVATSPDDLAAAAAQLLAAPEQAARLGRAGRELVEAGYSEIRAAEGIRALVRAAAGDPV
jgi:glycosyltransferase involved in cell wall biosynthesis